MNLNLSVSTNSAPEPVIPKDSVCIAIRPNGVRCIRPRKYGEPYCGTHYKIFAHQDPPIDSTGTVITDDAELSLLTQTNIPLTMSATGSRRQKRLNKCETGAATMTTNTCTDIVKLGEDEKANNKYGRFVSIWVEEIDGISHYIDAFGNVYCHEDILNLSKSLGTGSIEQLNAARKKNTDSFTVAEKTKSKRKSKSNNNVFVKVEIAQPSIISEPEPSITEGAEEKEDSTMTAVPTLTTQTIPTIKKPRVIAKYALVNSVYSIASWMV